MLGHSAAGGCTTHHHRNLLLHCSDVIQRDVVDIAIAENGDDVVFQYPLVALVDYFSRAHFELVIHLLNRKCGAVTELTSDNRKVFFLSYLSRNHQLFCTLFGLLQVGLFGRGSLPFTIHLKSALPYRTTLASINDQRAFHQRVRARYLLWHSDMELVGLLGFEPRTKRL